MQLQTLQLVFEEFITPIVKVTKRSQTLSFYTIPEFEQWKPTVKRTETWKVKNYFLHNTSLHPQNSSPQRLLQLVQSWDRITISIVGIKSLEIFLEKSLFYTEITLKIMIVFTKIFNFFFNLIIFCSLQ